MKKEKTDPLEPKVFYPSIDHPGYKKASSAYVMGPVPLDSKFPVLDSVLPHFETRLLIRYEQAKYYNKKISEPPNLKGILPKKGTLITEKMWLELYDKADDVKKKADSYAIEAVKQFGLFALRTPDEFKGHEIYEINNQLNDNVINVMKKWQYLIDFGTRKEKLRAEKQLKELLKALIPETRGRRKRGVVVETIYVKPWYYREMFRLYHIRNVLRGPGKNRSQKVKAASENFRLPVELIRWFWGLDEEDNPDRQPFTLKEMARELTAQHFKITQHRVHNILAL